MIAFRLVLLTAHADFSYTGFLRSTMAGESNPSGDSRIAATVMVTDSVPTGTSEPLSNAGPLLRLANIFFRDIVVSSFLPGYSRELVVVSVQKRMSFIGPIQQFRPPLERRSEHRKEYSCSLQRPPHPF